MYKPFNPSDLNKIAPTDGNMDLPGVEDVKKAVEQNIPAPLNKVIDIITKAGEKMEHETEHFEEKVSEKMTEAEILAEREKAEAEREKTMAVLRDSDRRMENAVADVPVVGETRESGKHGGKMAEFKDKYADVKLHGSQVAEEKFKKYLGMENSGETTEVAELTEEQKVEAEKTYEEAVLGNVDKQDINKKVEEGKLTPTQGRLYEWVNDMSQELSVAVDSEKMKDFFGNKVFEYLQTKADYTPFNPDEAGNVQDLLTRFEGMYKNDQGEYIGSYSQDSMNRNMANVLEQLGGVLGREIPGEVSEKFVDLYRKGELENLPNMQNIPEEISGYLQQLPETVGEAGEDLAYAAEVLPKLTDGDMTVFDKLRAYQLWKKEEKWLERAQDGMKGWYEKAGGQSIPLVGEGLGKLISSDQPKEVLYEFEKNGLDQINKFGLQGVTDVIETLKNNGVEQDKIVEFFNNDQYRYLLDAVSGVPMNKDDISNLGGMVEKWQGLFRKENFGLTKSEDFIKDNGEALLFLTGLMHNTPDVMERFSGEYFTGEDRDKWYEEWIKGRPIPS